MGFALCRRAVVAELAGLGATVHTCARNGTELDKCLRGWEEEGFRVSGSVCDVSFRDQREVLVDTVSSVFNGNLNILVGLFFSFFHIPIRHFSLSRENAVALFVYYLVNGLVRSSYTMLEK